MITPTQNPIKNVSDRQIVAGFVMILLMGAVTMLAAPSALKIADSILRPVSVEVTSCETITTIVPMGAANLRVTNRSHSTRSIDLTIEFHSGGQRVGVVGVRTSALSAGDTDTVRGGTILSVRPGQDFRCTVVSVESIKS